MPNWKGVVPVAALPAVDCLVYPQLLAREILLMSSMQDTVKEDPEARVETSINGMVEGLNGLIDAIRGMDDKSVQDILMSEAKKDFANLVLNNSLHKINLMKRNAYGVNVKKGGKAGKFTTTNIRGMKPLKAYFPAAGENYPNVVSLSSSSLCYNFL